MSLADTYLYYPLIRIPESTMVHSLLFQNRIKRIIPPQHEMDEFHHKQATLPNDICRQYLGYEFIESADYWEAKETIADLFYNFLEEANRTKNPQHFEPLLGDDYKNKLGFAGNSKTFGTQYFVYDHKFSGKVFDKLESLNWMRYDEHLSAYELNNELCNVYMSLLAACISKLTKEPISTGMRQADEILRTPLFIDFFSEVLPIQMRNSYKYNELCINLLMGCDDKKEVREDNIVPLDKVLTFQEAVRIRCGLENERQDFCTLVDDITDKAKAIDPNDPEAFISLEVKDVIEKAQDYMTRIKQEAISQVSNDRKDYISRIQTGLSATLPVIGAAADAFTGATPAPGVWSATGITLGLGTYFLPKFFQNKSNINIDGNENGIMESRHKAYIFMNRLWDIQGKKLLNA